MKKVLAILLSALLLMACVPLGALPVLAASSGTTGDCTWTLDDGHLTISGNGAMGNCSSNSRPWGNGITSVTIEEGVTQISNYAFAKCTVLANISIPDTVTVIGDDAFYECTSLTALTIGNSVTTIGDNAFFNCTSLTALTIGNSVTTISDNAFFNCTSLTAVTIPDSVTTIDSWVFYNCTSLSSVTIGDNVTSIGKATFGWCTSLTSITLPASVTSIANEAFSFCDSMTKIIVEDTNPAYCSVDGVLFDKEMTTLRCYPGGKSGAYTIPDGVTTIGAYAFPSCQALTSVFIPNSITTILWDAFYDCTSLTSVTIGNSVTTIGEEAFSNCTSLKTVTIPDSVTSIGVYAFYECDSLTDVYYAGSEEDRNNIAIGSCNNDLLSATWHYNHSDHSPAGAIPALRFEDPILFLGVGETQKLTVHSHDVANVNGELVYFNDKIVNNSELNWSVFSSEESGNIRLEGDGTITGLSEGYANVSVYSKNNINLGTFCHIYVGDPNALEYTAIYSEEQCYSEGGFFSETSSMTDCVEIYLLFQNKVKEAVSKISGIDQAISKDTDKEIFKDIQPITLTATIDGDGLSFERESYQNTYTTTFDALALGTATDDILMLFPYDFIISSEGNSYIVNVKLESESFDTLQFIYKFTVQDLEFMTVDEHIQYIDTNPDYRVSKQNIYGNTMVSLKEDKEYLISKHFALDFDNYYEIVLADIVSSMLQVHQVEIQSLVSSVLKEWRGNYKTLLDGFSTMVEDTYGNMFDKTETKIDKLLKKSKYELEGIYVKDELHETVLDLLGNANNASKINNIFAKMDKAGQAIGMFDLGGKLLTDAVEWGNKISILNAYANADSEFKAIMKTFADSIPDSERKMKEAVYDYINFSESDSGQTNELLESFTGLMQNVTLDVFSSCIGGRLIDYLGAQLINWVGTTTVKGVALSAMAEFAAVKTAFGAVSTGFSLGLCFSDILCNNSGKAKEMGKVVAVCEYAPYVIDTLTHYETKLRRDQSLSAVTYYEYAFALHKATQSYIFEHTIKALEVKRDSIVIQLLNKDGDYDIVIADTLANKVSIDNLNCHGNHVSPVVSHTKVIAIKCPVDVRVYDAVGNEMVRIVNDVEEYIAPGIYVFVEDRQKYIALPSTQQYSVNILATDSGTMEYIVSEYEAGVQLIDSVKEEDIVLENYREFVGNIAEQPSDNPTDYALAIQFRIVSQPESVKARLGETATITAGVSGEKLTYQWYIKKDGSNQFSASNITTATWSTLISHDFVKQELYCMVIDMYGNTLVTDTVTVEGASLSNRDLGVLQQYLAEWDVAVDIALFDFTGDGRINNRDLGLLQQYLGDWDVELK